VAGRIQIRKVWGVLMCDSSIGGSWNQEGRVSGMDAQADKAIKAGKGNEKMNVKLEPCRGKGMK
jgi:Novel toxin 15